MDVEGSASQGTHYHADDIYLLHKMGIKEGARALWYSELSLHQLGFRPTVFIPRWTTHPCILYQVRDACGANEVVRESSWRCCYPHPGNGRFNLVFEQ